MDGIIYKDNTFFEGTYQLLELIDKIGGRYVFITILLKELEKSSVTLHSGRTAMIPRPISADFLLKSGLHPYLWVSCRDNTHPSL